MTTQPAEVAYPSTEGAECPYPFYDRIRNEAPIYELPDRPNVFAVSRFEDVAEVARNTEVFSSVESRSGLNPFDHLGAKGPRPSMIESDDPAHKAARDLCFQPFKPGRIKAYDPMVTELVDELIDGFASRGRMEFVEEFAAPLPILVTCRLLGLPLSDYDLIRQWGALEVSGLAWMPEERQQQQLESAKGMAPYITEKLLERREAPGDDILSELIQRQIEAHGEFDLEWVRTQAAVILAGGIITTAHAISSGMLLLVEQPERMAEVRADLGLVPKLTEEILRIESPVQWVPRRVTRDTELGGVSIPAGAHVLLMWGSANRDPAAWDAPEEFRVAREGVARHMAFGLGAHFCLGAPLARLEMRIAFERLLTRLDDLRLAADAPEIRHIDSPSFRGIRELPLEFRPAA
jgi:cytochrome P450